LTLTLQGKGRDPKATVHEIISLPPHRVKVTPAPETLRQEVVAWLDGIEKLW
jgi:hypothetical protein